jgi:hypothetical protein
VVVQGACLARALQPGSLTLRADFPIGSYAQGGEKGFDVSSLHPGTSNVLVFCIRSILRSYGC